MRIGILGSGQLGRMLAQAGAELGHTFSFYDSTASTATAGLGPVTEAPFEDRAALRLFASECDVITYEFENVPCETAHFLERLKPVYPPPRALEVSQDRLIEKEFLQKLGIGTPRFEPASSETELAKACATLGYPCIAKTRRFGYDGKGQYRLNSPSDVATAWKALQGAPLLVEGFVPFSRELSVIATRDQFGTIALYPLSYNVHIDGILHRSEIPAPDVVASVRSLAYAAITKVLEALNYVGTLAIELFEVRGEILANEMAPRVHNSGHATIEGIQTSQFSNHIRAVTGAPLGYTEPSSRAVMYNIIGKVPDLKELNTLRNVFVHLYGKAERAGRKLGHITLLNPSEAEEALVDRLCSR
jgi:5-(carboxyamino)imidazole ribonucleotide synthase